MHPFWVNSLILCWVKPWEFPPPKTYRPHHFLLSHCITHFLLRTSEHETMNWVNFWVLSNKVHRGKKQTCLWGGTNPAFLIWELHLQIRINIRVICQSNMRWGHMPTWWVHVWVSWCEWGTIVEYKTLSFVWGGDCKFCPMLCPTSTYCSEIRDKINLVVRYFIVSLHFFVHGEEQVGLYW